MSPLILLALLHLGSTESIVTFRQKQNSALYCDIPNHKEADAQLDISPSKHIITTYAKGVKTKKIYNGAVITIKCKDTSKTFSRKLVRIGGQTASYKLFKSIVVQCLYKDIILPNVFDKSITNWCASGCPQPSFSEGYQIYYTNKVDGHKKGDLYNITKIDDEKAPMPDKADLTLRCRAGYVKAWKDDGSSYFKCENTKYNMTQSQLVTCAPGCKDLYADIVPYVRGLYIDDQNSAKSTERNMVWPGAPYPWGAKLKFECYGRCCYKFLGTISSRDKVSDGGYIHCWKEAGKTYKDKNLNEYGGDKEATARQGYWTKEVPTCTFGAGTRVTLNILYLVVLVFITGVQ